MYLDAFLPDMAFTPGDVPMLGDSFVPTCTVVGFPGTSLPGLLDDLNHLAVEYRWVTRFLCLDKDDAQVELEKYRKRWWSKRKGLWTMLKEEATKQESALVDSAAEPKSGDRDAEKLHRIDPEFVKTEILAAGFKLDASSEVLANKDDKHDWNSSPKASGDKRGTSDRFVLTDRAGFGAFIANIPIGHGAPQRSPYLQLYVFRACNAMVLHIDLRCRLAHNGSGFP